jgi:tetrahydromethanopterin S-methyltransferase subunit D
MLAIVSTAAAGDTTVVAAVAGKKIRVKGFQLANQVATAQAVKLRSGTTDLHAALPLPLAVGGSLSAADDGDSPDDFLVETTAGALLAINLSAATAITGTLIYSLE